MTETLTYEDSGRIGEVEFRRYKPIIIATVSGANKNENFWILFRYITGNNRSGKKVPMTAPVITPDKIAMTAPVISDANAMSVVLARPTRRKKCPNHLITELAFTEYL